MLPLRPLLPLLLPLLLSTAPASAQTTSPALAAIKQAEFAFATDALVHGTRAAFLATMHDSALVFNDAVATLARPYWLAQPTAPIGSPILRWAPALVGAATAGDLGYTTGPWVLTATDGKPLATGQFFTIWARLADGSYKWLLDDGVSSPLATAPAALPKPMQVVNSTEPPLMGAGAPLRAVRELDEQLTADIARRGLVAAYSVRLHEQARLLRDDHVPFITLPAIQRQLATEPVRQLSPAGGRVAASRELAYSYGTYQETGGGHGAYVHLWRQGRSGWLLLLEVMNAAPAKK